MKLSEINVERKHVHILIVVAIILYGLHLRFAAVTLTEVNTPIRADAQDYFFYALNLNQYSVFSRENTFTKTIEEPTPDALRSPGFPFFASFFFQAENLSQSISNVIVVQTLLQIAAFCALSFFIYREFSALWSAFGLFLLWSFPHFISINTYFLTESLFTSCLCLSLFLLWTSNIESTRFKTHRLLLAGLLIATAALVRPVIEYFPIFILILCALFSRIYFKAILLFSVSALTPIILWKIRNITAIDALSDPTLMINGIYHGSFPNFMFNGDPKTFGFPYRFDPRAEEVYQGVGATLNVLKDKFIEKPWDMTAWYITGKQLFLWQWNIIAGQGDIFIYPVNTTPYHFLKDMVMSRAVHIWIHGLWVFIGLITAIIITISQVMKKFSDDPIWLFMSTVIIYAMAIHTLTTPLPRYGIPFKVILIPVSIYGMSKLLNWCVSRWNSQKSLL